MLTEIAIGADDCNMFMPDVPVGVCDQAGVVEVVLNVIISIVASRGPVHMDMLQQVLVRWLISIATLVSELNQS